ncbi:MAG: 30S ribosomal protein S6 [Candidatus Pacebacteria bacterium]|nr:30S ribosomal protein S6 [Candidatus Paceibacterota bacterium]MBP9839647.1 30S ribosomal protein S6 [Candidatus Paceibacterota bacterium]
MQEMENNAQNKGEGRVYELGYLLVSTLSEENVPAEYGNLKELISSLGGEVVADEMPRMINLAYTMDKVWKNNRTRFDNAYFGWIKFEINPEKIADIKAKLALNENLIRSLLIKTVKENTIASKRFVHKDMGKRKVYTVKKEGEEEVPVEINKEEIDKEIEALVSA